MPYTIVPAPTNINGNVTGFGPGLGGTTPFVTVYTVDNQIFDKLKNLLLTRLGERVLQPTFGTDLFKILFEVNSQDLQQQINEYIQPAVAYWLPEINLTNIIVKTIEDDPTMIHTIEITIEYSTDSINLQSLTLAINDNGIIQVQQGQ